MPFVAQDKYRTVRALLQATLAIKIAVQTFSPCLRDVLTSMTVELGTSNTRFSAALNKEGKIAVTGAVKSGSPFLTSLGNFDVDLVLEVGLSTCRCHCINVASNCLSFHPNCLLAPLSRPGEHIICSAWNGKDANINLCAWDQLCVDSLFQHTGLMTNSAF